MQRIPVRNSLIAVGIGLAAIVAPGCGSSEDPPLGAKTMAFQLTDAGCVPNSAKAAAGPIVFEVENAGTSKVSEFEVLDGDTILGEKENLSDGLSGSFSLTLDQGEYVLYCPGGDDEKGTLTVSGKLKAETSPQVEDSISRYRDYLEKNTAELISATAPFVAAVEAGDVEKAKALYAPARVPYERIEPVAESFGELDPRIDARENDVPASEWSGFHVIEKALWVDDSTGGMTAVATQLLADIEELQRKVKTVDLQAVQIANGANELLGEVSASKITGEEERYSHIDLVDFEANVEGAEAAFESVEPLLSEKDPKLAKEIEAQFSKIYASLKPYRRGNGFVSYAELTQADTRKLAQQVDALAELLSEVPAQIVGG
ncbi:MAG TPA: iron uptake system protein EfeO [Solirubrobacterales bacterium]|nr:iron uptake system protein EfeO [Solirubrobacterales bacterium]